MKTFAKTIFSIGLIVAVAQAAAAEINYAYRIAGAKEIAPLQVFDDGKNIYLQLTSGRLAAPPVPFSADGTPLAYEIRPPYMVLPKVDRMTLRVGALRTLIQSANDTNDAVLSPAGIRGANIWYGAATEALITSYAATPVPAESAPKKAVQPKVAAPSLPVVEAAKPQDLPKPVFQGRFSVAKNEIEQDPRASREILFKISQALTVDALTGVLDARLLHIEADGSSASYRKAAEVKRLLSKQAVIIKPVGAPAGHIRISKGG